jgi:hypothetical protein
MTHAVHVGYSFRPGITEDIVQVVLASATGVSVDDVEATLVVPESDQEDDQVPTMSMLGNGSNTSAPVGEQTNYTVIIKVKDAINSRYLKNQLQSLQPIRDAFRKESILATVLAREPATSVMTVTAQVRAVLGQAQASVPDDQDMWSMGLGLKDGTKVSLISHFTDYSDTIKIWAGALKYELATIDEGMKAWTDRKFVYKGVPMPFRGGILLRGPHFTPSGIKTTIYVARMRKVCVFADVSNPLEDGGLAESMPGNWTVSRFTMTYYSEAFKRSVPMATWCRDFQGNFTLPQTTTFVRMGMAILREKPVAPGSPYFPVQVLPPGSELPPASDPSAQQTQAQLEAAKSAGDGAQVQKRLPDGTLVVRSAASAVNADKKAEAAANATGCGGANATSLIGCR